MNILINQRAGERVKNVEFKDQQPSWTYAVDAERDPTFGNADTNDSVADFFERPVKVVDLEWTVDGFLDYSFNPWVSFFEDPKVANRLTNFKNLRADLKVKFVINGNPFYYGRSIASATMLSSLDSHTIFRSGNRADLIQASQRPHIYLNPTTSEGGELLLPFFYPKNALSIPDREWRRMGTVDVRSINVLRHANQSTESLTLSIFVMATSVDISTPTSRMGIVVPQGDEYGLVSGPAHSVANFANGLSQVPRIGPYARATSMVASGVGAVASLFGFSRPREVKETENYRHRPFGNLASTNVSDNVQSLALDAKKEVTIDPRVVGLAGNDEMALVPLARRESYLTTFEWTPTDVPDSHLFSMDISPMQGARDGSNLHVAPSAWVAMPFKYWKGSMNIRFKVVSSDYHRGRIKVVWDPDYFEPTDGDLYNTNYTTMIDISAEKDFTVSIGWGQQTSYLKVGSAESIPSFSLDGISTKNPFANGTLSVFVVNELTSPSSSMDPIEVNVFTAMDNDFEVACPDSRNLREYKPLTISPDETTFDSPEYIPPAPGSTPGPEDTPTGEPPGTIPAGGPGDTPVDPPEEPVVEALFNDTASVPMVFAGVSQSTIVYDYGLGAQRSQAASIVINVPSLGRASSETVDVTMALTPFHSAIQDDTTPLVFTIAYVNTPPGAPGGPLFSGSGTWADFNGVDFTFPMILGAGGESNYLSINVSSLTEQYAISKLAYPVPGNLTYVEVSADEFTVSSSVSGPLAISIDPVNGNTVDIPFTTPSEDFTFSLPSPVAPSSPIWMRSNHTSTASSMGMVYTIDGIAVSGISVRNVGTVSPNIAFEAPAHTGASQFTLAKLAGLNETIKPAYLGYFTDVAPQGAEAEAEQSDDVNAPISTTIETSMAPTCDVGQINTVHFGEQVSSWRQVLHRYDMAWRLLIQDSTTYVLNDLLIGTAPPGGGDAVSHTNLLNWVRPAYLAYRGALRYKALMHGRQNSVRFASISRTDEVDESIVTSNGTKPEYTFTGFAVEPLFLTGGVDAEVPWYSNLRFHPARSTHNIYDSLLGFERTWLEIYAESQNTDEMDVLVATGEDFSLHMFVGVPVLTPREVAI
jgi:hypothetical protein